MSLFLALTLAAGWMAGPLDSNRIADPGLESSPAGWKFWARSPDSGRTVPGSDCHTGTGCLKINHEGAQDWALWPDLPKFDVHPGEIWRWSLWARTDSLASNPSLGFATRNAAATVLDWGAAMVAFPKNPAGWVQITTRLAVPRGCSSIQPRLTGAGRGGLAIDDAELALESAAPVLPALQLQNDSLRLEVDPFGLGMKLFDPTTSDTIQMDPLPGFHLDSARQDADTLVLQIRNLTQGWPAQIRLWLAGGSLHLALNADSATAIATDFRFPGSIATHAGQSIAIPRGTGLSWPVDGPLSPHWSLRSSPFWEWQVSQTVTGATNGATGFAISIDQPWDTRLELTKNGSNPSRPDIIQVASKGVFGHLRSAVVSPLRGGGFVEMARRHRHRQEELGRIKDWTRKIRENPEVEKLRGAVDWWVMSGFTWRSFDTLRWMGLERAVIHWGPSRSADVDSMVARGWLMSIYDNWADAFPADTSLNGRQYSDGAILRPDGSPMLGWLEKHSDGSTRQALEICAARHPALARAKLVADRAKYARNARFVDVELSVQPQECWSSVHPVDRRADLENRVRALGIVKDSFRLVVGSEQTRDLAHAVVDYGEGPMSIASVADAGYDWSTPEAPEGPMDSLSMDPSLRIPLLPLTSHDAFAPTWYTGDGQSKVPKRWDDKDVWNLLYATMPLIMPKNRPMWDSLQPRYLRTINAVGALLSRCQFAPMTGFDRLSVDGKVQRTRFATGWSVAVNFDDQPRWEAGVELPAKGFLASGPDERIERVALDGAVRTRVRLSDRWFLDPEGSEANLDGIRTTGSVLLKRLNDTTLHLALLGNQDHIDLCAASLIWPSSPLRATVGTTNATVALQDLGAGWQRLSAAGNRFFTLHGAFGKYLKVAAAPTAIRGSVYARGSEWELVWTQSQPTAATISVHAADGRCLSRTRMPVKLGTQKWRLPRPSQAAWIQLLGDGPAQIFALPPL